MLRRWVPPMDLVETDGQFVLRADLPGVTESDVKIEVEDDVLTISGERKSEHEDRKKGYVRVERAFGSFRRSVTLPSGIEPEEIAATFDNGVLEVRIPKPAERKPHTVEIGVGAAPTSRAPPRPADNARSTTTSRSRRAADRMRGRLLRSAGRATAYHRGTSHHLKENDEQPRPVRHLLRRPADLRSLGAAPHQEHLPEVLGGAGGHRHDRCARRAADPRRQRPAERARQCRPWCS